VTSGVYVRSSHAGDQLVRVHLHHLVGRLTDKKLFPYAQLFRARDRYGVSWQIVPVVLGQMLGDPDPAKAQRVMQAMLRMIKLDRSEEHTSELQSLTNLVCRLLLEKKKNMKSMQTTSLFL